MLKFLNRFSAVLIFSFLASAFIFSGTAFSEESEESGGSVRTEYIAFSKSINTDGLLEMPLQDRGRLKPFDSFSRESNLFITGKTSRWSLSAAEFYLGLLSYSKAEDLRVLEIREPDVRVLLEFPKDKRLYSLSELASSRLFEIARPIQLKEKKNKRLLDTTEKSLLEVTNQAWLLKSLIRGDHLFSALDFSSISKKEDSENPHAEKENSALSIPYTNYIRSLSSDQKDWVVDDWRINLIKAVKSQPMPEEFRVAMEKISLEVSYNKYRPFFIAGLMYLLISIFSLIPVSKKILSIRVIQILTAIPLTLIIIGFYIRIYITKFPPVTTMYGTMLWVAFGLSVFGYLFYAIYKNNFLMGLLSFGSGVFLILTESIPLILSPDMDPIVAVLRSSFWLTTHVLTITLSYAAFTLAMIIGNMVMIKTLFGKADPKFIKDYAHYVYRAIQLGVFLITAGIILGGVWADYSWGRFWGWDPKETWALIADLGYILILHARFIGWLSPFGLLVGSTAAYLLVIMAWYGVNFILASGLHSYGFSSGGTALVVSFLVFQLAIIAACLLVAYFKKKPSS